MSRGPQNLIAVITDIVSGTDFDQELIQWPTSNADHEDRSKQIIKEFSKFLIVENAVFTHQDKVLLIAAGTQETRHSLSAQKGYEHLTEIAPMGALEYTEILTAFDETETPSTADLFSAIVLATESINTYCQTLKSMSPDLTKKIYVVTAQGGCSIDPDGDEETVGQHLKSSHFELYLVNCGLGRDAKATAMRQLATKMGATYMGKDEINDYVLKPRKKRVAPTTKSRLGLSFGGYFEIPVFVYLGVKEETMPSPKSESIYASEEASKAVMSRTYYVKNDDLNAEVPQEERTRAYLYGKHLIPVGPAETAILAPEPSEKSLSVLGTLPRSKSDALWLSRPTELIVPEPGHKESYVSLMCLIRALREKELTIVARFVWRKNVTPKLVLLTPPSPDTATDCLIMNYLPFSEDLKLELSLPVLPEPERPQQDAMNKLVASMNLIKSVKRDDDGIFTEEMPGVWDECFHPKSSWNPALRLFYHWSLFKLIRGPNVPLPSPPPEVAATFEITEAILGDPAIVESLHRLFPLEKVQTRRDALRKQWHGALVKQPGQPINVDEVVSTELPQDLHVSVLEPQETFKAIVALHDPQALARAFIELEDIVLDRAVEMAQSPGVETTFLDLLKFHRDQTQSCGQQFSSRHNTLLVSLADIFRLDMQTYESLVVKILDREEGDKEVDGGREVLRGLLEPVASTLTAVVTTTVPDFDELE